MADTEGSGQRMAGLYVSVLRTSMDADCTAVALLSSDTVAQIVWLLGESQIQVADTVPRIMRHAVARHLQSEHMKACRWHSCAQARIWLGSDAWRAPPIRASLPA